MFNASVLILSAAGSPPTWPLLSCRSLSLASHLSSSWPFPYFLPSDFANASQSPPCPHPLSSQQTVTSPQIAFAIFYSAIAGRSPIFLPIHFSALVLLWMLEFGISLWGFLSVLSICSC